MILSRRSAVSICADVVRRRAATPRDPRSDGDRGLPGPGVDTYKSNLYQIDGFDGSTWIPAYVYKFSRRSRCHWHFGTSPSLSFLTFGTSGPVDIRVTKLSGPITHVDDSPHSKYSINSERRTS
jgi:hypothetical protein